ncbi:MAG TPA: hypothetical protein EYN92_03795 [Dehalococcoidia bacterium]|jgi:Tol biopolymer transport system component|nr:hypothetical protein [Dehalococcoidia bacterium]
MLVHDENPEWSPDGSIIIFISDRDDITRYPSVVAHIHSIELD